MKNVLALVGAFMVCVVGLNAQSSKDSKKLDVESVIYVQDSLIFKLDSAFTYITDENGSLSLSGRKIFKYNEANYVDDIHWHYLVDSVWVKEKKENYKYDAYGSAWMKEELLWDADKGEWKSVRKKAYTQNNNQQEVDIVYSELNDDGEWVDVWRQGQNYNADSRLLSYQTQKWNVGSQTWESYWDYNRYYDSEGHLLQVSHKVYNPETRLWVDKWECINEFDADQLSSELIIDWNENGDEWNNLKKVDLSYPQADRVVRESSQWNMTNNTWNKGLKTTDIQDKSDKLKQSISEFWDEQEQAWVASHMHITRYNDHDIKLEEETKEWSAEASEWKNSFKTVYYYSELGVDKDAGWISDHLFIYPNPVKSEMFLKFKGEALSLKIYNIKGALVKVVDEPQSDVAINVNGLKKGVYIAVVEFQDVVINEKFVKE